MNQCWVTLILQMKLAEHKELSHFGMAMLVCAHWRHQRTAVMNIENLCTRVSSCKTSAPACVCSFMATNEQLVVASVHTIITHVILLSLLQEAHVGNTTTWKKINGKLGWAWASPTLIITTALARGIIVSEYLCIIYPMFVAPWFPRSMYALKCSMYFSIIDVLMCMIRKHSSEWLELLVPAMIFINEDR